MESSGIEGSLVRIPGTLAGHRKCLGLLTLLSLGSALALPAQAPGPGSSYVAPDLPRFTLREILTGRGDSLARIPGRWLSAAAVAVPESLPDAAYRETAVRSGVVPLQGNTLASERSQHVMGLYRRAELAGASRRTLESIRSGLPSEATRARFDHLFRPRGEWVVDIHDAALTWARLRVPGIAWDAARRALALSHWLQRSEGLAGDEAVRRALYGLAVLAADDSAAYEAVRVNMWRADTASAAAVQLLLTGYAMSQQWYVDALGFFLTEPWVPDGGEARSLADYVRAHWNRGQTASAVTQPRVPEIRARFFGYPQAVPYYGVPSALFARLVKIENQSAHTWLEVHGEASLLRALRNLPSGDTSPVLLQAGPETIRLTTVPRRARESLNGFLEPQDAIVIDPGYSPLLALGALVHEWQHLIFRHRQLEGFATSLGPPSGQLVITLPGVDPYVAEGFAEWSTEQILAPLAARWPLLALGELEKRAGLAREGPDEQHTLGYALVRALAAALPDPAYATELLLRHAERPAAILHQPAVRRAWSKHRRAVDRVFEVPGRRILIPEVTFTIEDGFPEVVASRILLPAHGEGER